MFIVLCVAIFSALIGNSQPALVGALASLGAGFGKEFGDRCCSTNRWDWKDILADLVGTAIGCIIILVAL